MALTGSAYAGLADAWAADASLAYRPLARHLVSHWPGSVSQPRGLDAGSGSGLAGEALRDRGVRVIAADLAPDMAAASGVPAVAGDVRALPFRDGTFDVSVAAYVINHLPDPVTGMRELRRVTRVGGTVLVATFGNDRAPAKGVVDEVAAAYGFVVPQWYAEFKTSAEGIGSSEDLEAVVRTAGFSEVEMHRGQVDVGIRTPEDVVRYRLALPHLHRFVSAMSRASRTSFLSDAAEAVRRTGEDFRPDIVEAVALV